MDRHEEARIARAQRIATDINRLRAAGGAARDLHTSKIEALADRLAHELGDDYTSAALGSRIETLIEAHPLLMSARTSGDAQQKSPLTVRDWRAMPPAERLEKINEQEHEAREAEAAAERKLGKTDYTPDQLKSMRPGARLEIANDMRRFGVKPEPKTPDAEAIRKMDAARRLDIVNQQIESSRKNASKLGKRLAQVRKESA